VFELLGVSLLLACLLAFNSLASLLTALLWRLASPVARGWSAQTRARLLFLFRTFPATLAILCVAFLLLPAYLAHEPRHTAEVVSLKLGMLAFLSAIGIAFAAMRAFAAWRATARLTADWLSKAQPIVISGINITTYRIDHPFPVVAIVGVIRPRLFVANRIIDLLSSDEIKAVIAHENGHLDARDNLKRGLMRACRDALLIIPTGRLLDRAWHEAAEEAADEKAAGHGSNVALDLASALVKIARHIPQGTRPTMPAGVFLFGDDDEATGIKARVRRLVEFASGGRKPILKPNLLANPTVWLGVALSVVAVNFLLFHPIILLSVHAMIEHAVRILN
jgi:Zn-dependent protease with chaperone function